MKKIFKYGKKLIFIYGIITSKFVIDFIKDICPDCIFFIKEICPDCIFFIKEICSNLIY